MNTALLLAGMGGILAALFLFWRAFAAGKSAGATQEQSKQAEGRLKAVKQAHEIEDDIDRLGPADLDEHLAKWMRDGDGR